jgi:hypothetical protein
VTLAWRVAAELAYVAGVLLDGAADAAWTLQSYCSDRGNGFSHEKSRPEVWRRAERARADTVEEAT